MNDIKQWIDDELAKLAKPQTTHERDIFPPLARAFRKFRSKVKQTKDDLWWMRDERLTYFHVFDSGKRVIVSITFDEHQYVRQGGSRSAAIKEVSKVVNEEFDYVQSR